MKNLKRALSFAVAAVMLVGMMAIGTSAFTDDAAIENSTAVNVMYNLGIINGKPDGSFDPTATVTRGEMAKMICVALNGGKEPVLDATAYSYPDTVGHWAAGYIEYCTAMGIVSGSTDGNFYPNNPITGVEAAKMVLVALGYNAKNEGFVNDANWANNISIVANNNEMWEDVTSLPGAAISRDNAAQLLYNGMNVNQVTYGYELGTDENGALTSVPFVKSAGKGTILSQKFGLKSFVTVLEDVKYVAETEKYEYEFEIPEDATTHVAVADNGILKGTVDYSNLYMQEITVLYKEVANANNDKLYGVYGAGAVLATGVWGDLNDDDWAEDTNEVILVGETEVKAEADVLNLDNVYNYLNDAVAGEPADAAPVEVLDADGDGVADTIIVYPFAVGEVTYVGKTYIKVAVVDGATETFKFEDHNIYTGVAKNDWVQIARAANTVYPIEAKDTITKMATSTGTVEAYKAGEWKIDGAWYVMVDGSELDLNEEYTLVAVGKYIYNAEPVEEEEVALTDLVYVVAFDDAAANNSLNKGTQKAKVMFTDGTTAIVTVDTIDGNAVVKGTYELTADTTGVAALFTYEVDTTGNYELTAFDATDYIAGDVTAADEGKFTTANGIYRLNADAILFVIDSEDEVSIVAAADANKWETEDIDGTLYGEKVNGFVYAQLGVLFTDGDTGNSDAFYGVIVDEYYKVKVSTTEYYKVAVWDGTENVELTVKAATATVAEMTEGQLVSWTVDADGYATLTTLADAGASFEAIVAYDGTTIGIGANEYTLADDAVVLFIDSENVAGYADGEIMIAELVEGSEVEYAANVYAIFDDAEITVLVVEINNEWTGAVFAEAP